LWLRSLFLFVSPIFQICQEKAATQFLYRFPPKLPLAEVLQAKSKLYNVVENEALA
jgi:hypothetical protein